MSSVDSALRMSTPVTIVDPEKEKDTENLTMSVVVDEEESGLSTLETVNEEFDKCLKMKFHDSLKQASCLVFFWNAGN